MKKNSIITDVADYYTSKLSSHGATPQGVDWNGTDSQVLRFQQLSRVIADPASPFSVNDIGCGYGALLDYLQGLNGSVQYLGVDVSQAMVTAAQDCHPSEPSVRFLCSHRPDSIADYSVASGIFNVRLSHSDGQWSDYIHSTLPILHESSRRGFAFNCLTAYSDKDKMRDYLYYADPCYWFDYCKRHFSKNVALLHDYMLYEFTILVRK
jgi:SAM-dependent methyltransferase